MNQANQVRLILLEEFVKAQTRNPNYSLRAYSKKIGIATSAISEIFSGKRPITPKSAEKILVALNKDTKEVGDLLTSINTEGPQKYTPIDVDSFQVISDWHHFAIVSMTETKDFQSSPKWIAERLGITPAAADDSIQKLLNLKILKRDEKTKKLSLTGENFEILPEVATPALKKANRQNLDLAKTAIEQIPVAERDFTALTLCFDPDRIEDARKMVKNFRRSFSRVMEAGHKKEVFKLCIQLFPLTKRCES